MSQKSAENSNSAPLSVAQNRAIQMYIRARVAPSKAAKLSGMSVNTVKKVVNGQQVHDNSCLRLEAALDHHLKTKDQLTDQTLLLGDSGSGNSVMLLKKLSETLQSMLQHDDPKEATIDEMQQAQLRKFMLSCHGNLVALGVETGLTRK